MAYEFNFLDPMGKWWRLRGGEDGVMLAGGAAPGPKAAPTESRQVRGGGVGERVTALEFPQMVGSLEVGIDPIWMDDSAGVDVAKLRADFVAAWEATSPTRLGMLSVVRDDGERFTCDVRLGPDGVTEPDYEPGRHSLEELSVDVVSDGGLWWVHRKSQNNIVTVTNMGQVEVWVEIVWNGAGGAVTCPSGASFTLPTVNGEHRLFLDPDYSCEVVNTSTGERNQTAMDALIAAGVFPEAVPNDGKEYTFTIPSTARLEWKIGVLSPWR